MIFDANAFIGKWPYWPVLKSTAAELVSELHQVEIDKAAICSTRSVFVNWEDGNRETEAAAAAHADTLVPFACLGTRELSHQLHPEPHNSHDYLARGFSGIRLYPQHHSYHLLFESFVDEVLEDASAHRWPVLLPLRILMNWGVPSLDLGVIEAIVRRHPRVVWILSGINYLHELQLATSLLRRYDSVYLETSCVMGYAAIEKAVQLCGHEHILFGSGAPLQHAGASLGKILHAHIADNARDAVLANNFNRLLEEQK
jgi:predicted TIM-barrel fold metal-dependent hydrolase